MGIDKWCQTTTDNYSSLRRSNRYFEVHARRSHNRDTCISRPDFCRSVLATGPRGNDQNNEALGTYYTRCPFSLWRCTARYCISLERERNLDQSRACLGHSTARCGARERLGIYLNSASLHPDM